MSIFGIGSSNVPRPTAPAVRDNGHAGTARPASHTRQAPVTAPARRSPPANDAASQGLPVEPPPGTDPALWSVLSAEERGYFSKLGAMGPLTYGRKLDEIRGAQLPASRGGRLDVKA